MKSVTFKALTSCVLLASTLQAHAQQEAAGQDGKGEERNVMLNAADANKPREIQIGLPSEDVNVYENGLPAVYSSSVHKLSAHWRNDASLGSTGLLSLQSRLLQRAISLMPLQALPTLVNNSSMASLTTA